MSSPPTKDNKTDRVIDLYKEGKNTREIVKEVYLSFSTIGKIIRESQGQVEPKSDKSITSRAFFLFENKKRLVRVTMELDLNPTGAEKKCIKVNCQSVSIFGPLYPTGKTFLNILVSLPTYLSTLLKHFAINRL